MVWLSKIKPVEAVEKGSSSHELNRLRHIIMQTTGRCRIEPPIKLVGRPFLSYGEEMSSTDTLGLLKKYLHWYIPLLWRGGRRSLTGWLWWFCTRQLPSTVHDGTFSTAPHWAVVLPTHHLGQALACPTYIPMIRFCKMLRCLCHCNKRRLYFLTAPKYLHWHIPLLWRGGRRSLTGWLWWFCTRQLPSTVHDGTFSTAPHWAVVLPTHHLG